MTSPSCTVADVSRPSQMSVRSLPIEMLSFSKWSLFFATCRRASISFLAKNEARNSISVHVVLASTRPYPVLSSADNSTRYRMPIVFRDGDPNSFPVCSVLQDFLRPNHSRCVRHGCDQHSQRNRKKIGTCSRPCVHARAIWARGIARSPLRRRTQESVDESDRVLSCNIDTRCRSLHLVLYTLRSRSKLVEERNRCTQSYSGMSVDCTKGPS